MVFHWCKLKKTLTKYHDELLHHQIPYLDNKTIEIPCTWNQETLERNIMKIENSKTLDFKHIPMSVGTFH